MAANGAFRCLVSGVDLCMNGGVCQTDLNEFGQEYCECPEGYVNDRTVFHQNNPKCALPSNALLGVLIANGLISAIMLFMLLRIVQLAKGRAKRIVLWACALLIATFGHALALFLEQGQFRADPICLLITVAVASGWGIEVCEIIALPIFSIYPRMQLKVKYQIRLSFAFILTSVSAALISMSVFAYDIEQFNRASVSFQLVLFGGELIFASIVVHYARLLNAFIKEVHLDTPEDMGAKIRALQLGSLSLAFTQVPLVAASIAFIIVGNVPYMWLFTFMLITVVPPCVAWSSLGIFKGNNYSSSQRRMGHFSFRNSKVSKDRKDSKDSKDSKESREVLSVGTPTSMVAHLN